MVKAKILRPKFQIKVVAYSPAAEREGSSSSMNNCQSSESIQDEGPPAGFDQ